MSAIDLIKSMVAARGSITIAEFMTLAAQHPVDGYYRHRDAIGAEADFTTAPEISQIFGELIGLCLLQAWLDRGADPGAALVELGPGRGTLMADALRAIRHAGGGEFIREIHLVDKSLTLRRQQSAVLSGEPVQWHDEIESLPSGAPLYVIANEFFDALPARQFAIHEERFQERVVTMEQNALVFGFVPSPDAIRDRLISSIRFDAGQIVEVSPERDRVAHAVGSRIRQQGGAALVVDYGGNGPASWGNSLQAVFAHQNVSPLDHVGSSDLSTLVDFGALAHAAESAGAVALGPVTQGAFLRSLGAAERFEVLCRSSDPQVQEQLRSGVRRLTHDDQMGTLFKVLGIIQPSAPALAGFEPGAGFG